MANTINRKQFVAYLLNEDVQRLEEMKEFTGVSKNAIVIMMIREKHRALFPNKQKQL